MDLPRTLVIDSRLWSQSVREFQVLLYVSSLVIIAGSGTLLGSEAFDPTRLEKETVVAGCVDPMQLEVLGDGQLLFIERAGVIRMVRYGTTQAAEVSTVGTLPVAVFGEVGLLGIAADRAFEKTGWIYLFFCPQSQPHTLRLSRFTIDGQALDIQSEVRLLEYPIDADGAIHMGGGLWMDDQGDLWLGTGDNCPPIAELPVDVRPGQENFDAFRSSANSQDLRGKILRIHPEPNGTYTVPHGNLFVDKAQGRPEIFAMGCRNPFRLTVDPTTRAVLWGDVGPNIAESLGIGPDGYDEFNRATLPGNFGWPMFVGPNEAYRNFNFANRQPGELFDAQQPINPSPNNTGLRQLPAPQPAIIWYPSTSSRKFPTLGSGGRSAASGPVYRFTPSNPDGPHLPDRYRNRWFVFDWTRNWIQTVELDASGAVVQIEPFMPATLFRKPIDMKVGADGSLLVIEFGDKWGGNRDAEISRIVYRRGNRAPKAELTASKHAGRAPLQVQLDASSSLDPDGETLSFRWELNGKELDNHNQTLDLTLEQRGPHRVRLTAADSDGMTESREVVIQVGNEPPKVTIQSPRHGSFFDWGQTIHYSVAVDDLEEGTTEQGEIPSARVITSFETLTRRGRDELLDPGLALMRKTTCFSCHTAKEASAGPSYEAVAQKYFGADEPILEKLAEKIVSGGSGVWSNKPMPPHPQHSINEAHQMVRWVLSLASNTSAAPQPGKHGFFRTAQPVGSDASVLQLLAEYTDNGVAVDDHIAQRNANTEIGSQAAKPVTIPALRGEDRIVLHAKKKRAAFADRFHAAKTIDVFEGGVGLVARLAPQGWIAIDDLRLEEIDRVTLWLNHDSSKSGRVVLRQNAPDGSELASLELPASPQPSFAGYRAVTLALKPTTELTNLFVVYETPEKDHNSLSSSDTAELSVSWIEFHDSPATQQRKQDAQAARKRILLIPTQLDHAWATHMYTDVCRLLAATLNLTPGVEAIVSPDLDWPQDESLLDGIDAIVYYSRPAGDILLSPRHRAQAEKLLESGVGFTAIHWSTGAEKEIGADYEAILGGWFNFEFSGLTVDKQTLEQLEPSHPICRGWDDYLLRDEFYLNLKFHPQAVPLLKVHVNGQDQTVAWSHHRQDGGRSFGTTLGHFHDNFTDPRFRRMLVNGIMWTTGFDIPEAGLPVDVSERWLELEEPVVNQPQEWTYDSLRQALLQLQSSSSVSPSFENGKQLFERASCATCHLIDSPQLHVSGEQSRMELRLGPDLTRIRVKMSEADDPTGALLRSIVEPSEKIDDQYRSEIFQLSDGSILSGLVKGEQDGQIHVAINPVEPNQLRSISVDEIEARRKTDVSWMPAGLLNTLNETQVHDLLTYVEAGGNANYIAYQKRSVQLERWADSSLPVTTGLRLWLDASRINDARAAIGLPTLVDNAVVGLWPDASGHRSDASQRQLNAQPHFRTTREGNWLEFDGNEDYLVAKPDKLKTLHFTALMVVAPNHNRGWPGLLSGNALGRDDFRTGFNLDLMHEATESWQTMMSEGPGYQGVINLMNENHPWGEFLIVTLRSQPRADGLVLRINGRPQRTRERPAEWIQIDELTVGARYWSNDNSLPAFNRGFLNGRVAEVLFYDRPLTDDELVANEVYLWNSHEPLLDQRQ